MLAIDSPDPSPLVQTIIYMLGILGGYALLTSRAEWQRAWDAVREVVRGEERRDG